LGRSKKATVGGERNMFGGKHRVTKLSKIDKTTGAYLSGRLEQPTLPPRAKNTN